MHSFFNLPTSLKVCGITRENDVESLIEREVAALGFNFWNRSKRYIAPEVAARFSPRYQGKILRVGVFVNATHAEIIALLEAGVIDVAQLHGDESVEYCQQMARYGYPFIKAIGVEHEGSLQRLEEFKATAILLDAHAPEVYGGTGNQFDWGLAHQVISQHPELPIILAGGITEVNAAEAKRQLHPCALDVASGAESAPGVKDFAKIDNILAALQSVS